MFALQTSRRILPYLVRVGKINSVIDKVIHEKFHYSMPEDTPESGTAIIIHRTWF